jgi:hypothetical protein
MSTCASMKLFRGCDIVLIGRTNFGEQKPKMLVHEPRVRRQRTKRGRAKSAGIETREAPDDKKTGTQSEDSFRDQYCAKGSPGPSTSEIRDKHPSSVVQVLSDPVPRILDCGTQNQCPWLLSSHVKSSFELAFFLRHS